MRIPIDWLNEYVNIEKPTKSMAHSFTLLGLLLDKIDTVNGNEVLDLEHRMDRSDWLSILGCARDYAAFEGLELKYPKLHVEKGGQISDRDKIKIQVDCPDLVNRFNTKVFKNVKVKESPDWLKERLKAYGIASKNNIVDITNYVMIEFGQPMHAQDVNKMEKPEIVIRRAKKGEKLTTLLGETVELDDRAFVLTQNDKATVLGGIVGGLDTAVDESTTNIVLDAGNYNQVNIRQTSRRLKIQNETVLRYDKFLHPKLAQKAIERATYLILEHAQPKDGSKIKYFDNEDWYPKKWEEKEMTISLSRIKQVGGMNFSLEQVENILDNLEYEIIEKNSNKDLKVKVPYFRTDIEVEDDIVADVLRINSYEKIPVTPISSAPPKEITPKIYKFEDTIRNILVSLGFHEHVTSPLVDNVSHDEKSKYDLQQVKLENALASDKSALRVSIYETLSHVMRNYKKHKMVKAKVFEVGSIYFGNNEEKRQIEVIYNNFDESIRNNSKKVKKHLAAVLYNLGINDYSLVKKDERVFVVTNNVEIAELKMDSFTLYTKDIMEKAKKTTRVISKIENLMSYDVSIAIKTDKTFGETFQRIKNFNAKIVRVEVIDEYITKDAKTILVRITLSTKTKRESEKIKVEMLKELKNLNLVL